MVRRISPLSLCVLAAVALSFSACGSEIDATAEVSGDISADGVGDVGSDLTPEEVDDAGPDDSGPDEGDIKVPLERICPPNVTGCFNGTLLVCNKAGLAFDRRPCEAGTICFDGACVQCGVDADCDPTERCTDNVCAVPELQILTETLEPVLQGTAFVQTLQAIGGVPPYAWRIDEGALPAGVTLSAAGLLGGFSEAVGEFPFFASVEDVQGEVRTVALTLQVVQHGLTIKTVSPLPQAKAGEPYTVQMEALGGTSPLFWGIAAGALPAGLTLGASGAITGSPADSGTYDFTVKVFDNASPPLVAQKDFKLTVVIAPLEIIGDNVVDLFVTKLIVLPLIIVVGGVPVPYNGQLQAKGGKKPHHWKEAPLADLVKGLVPNGGLPPGLTISDSGKISGAVTDPSLAVSLTIPFTQIALSGFIFTARVEDDQTVPFHAEALYIIPTVPIGF
ncbi:MAG: Ig domain-containing protein [Myxococcota bacterium]